MASIQGIIFDMDGVLCDSERFICDAAVACGAAWTGGSIHAFVAGIHASGIIGNRVG